MNPVDVTLTINGETARAEVEPRTHLADFLREERRVRFALERRRRRVVLVGKGVGSRRVELAIDKVEQRLGPPMSTYRGHRHRGFVVPEAVSGSWLASLHQELIHPA